MLLGKDGAGARGPSPRRRQDHLHDLKELRLALIMLQKIVYDALCDPQRIAQGFRSL